MTPTQPDAVSRFAETAEQIGATTKRLEKAAILAAYFDPLADRDLAIAARYFSGYSFPLRDQRTTNIGGAALTAAILAATHCDDTWLRQRLVAHGDIGDAALDAFSTIPTPSPTLKLADISTFVETLAATGGARRKLEMVTDILRRATPLEAKYLVKLVGGDLRIGLQEGAVEDAIARWTSNPVARVQWANMLVGDIGETALMARSGRLDTARMRLFHPLKFMLATAAADLADVERQMGSEFVVEDKYDGIRAQAHVAPDLPESGPLHGVVHNGVRVALFSRTLDEITPSFPDLVAPLAALAIGMANTESAGLILDGEILPIRAGRILPFLELQKRLGRKTLTADLLDSTPVAFVAYDLLYANNAVRLDEPFDSRRALLEFLPMDGSRVIRTPSTRFTDVAALDAEFEAARARGNEGLMVKDPRSTYKPGRRGREWLKIKRAMSTLDVVVTAVEVGNGRRSHLLSDYTFAVRASEMDPALLNVGKAYSGLTDAELAEMSDWFRAHTLQEFAHGKVRTVEPQIVLEVTFDLVQPSKRHKSGYALRFPRILRIRDDKPPSEIDTLETVRRLADGQSMP
jgi:DNA ligase-1